MLSPLGGRQSISPPVSDPHVQGHARLYFPKCAIQSFSGGSVDMIYVVHVKGLLPKACKLQQLKREFVTKKSHFSESLSPSAVDRRSEAQRSRPVLPDLHILVLGFIDEKSDGCFLRESVRYSLRALMW